MSESLSALTADQLAEKVQHDLHNLDRNDEAQAALAELQTRANEARRDNDAYIALGRALQAAEARLAETQKALEQIARWETTSYDEAPSHLLIVRDIARAALTTHPADEA